MAFIHTNFLTGNDTTGDGSTALPYKTVFKALGLAASNDTIKVAGGQWTALSGDFTFTNGSLIVQTSTSQVGIIAVNDIITFEDGQFGFDKFHLTVNAITTTTLTLNLCWPGPTQISSGVFRMNSYPYTITGINDNLEIWNTTAIQPAGRTGITISGGWNSGYTDNSNGWTVGRFTGTGSATRAMFNATTNLGNWKQNLVFDKFMYNKLGAVVTSTTGFSYGVNTFAILDTGGNIWSLTQSSPPVGIYQKDSNTPVTVYGTLYGIAAGSAGNAYNPVYLPWISSETKFVVYHTAGATNIATFGNSQLIIASAGNVIPYTGASNTSYQQGSANKITLHFRSTNVVSPYYQTNQLSQTLNFGTSNANTAYYDKVILYANNTSYFIQSMANGNSCQIEDFEFAGPYASTSCILFNSLGQTLIDLSQEGKLIENFNPTPTRSYLKTPVGYTGPGGVFDGGGLNKLVNTNLYSLQVKDAEGLKTLDAYNNIYFKDSVNNTLRIQTGVNSEPLIYGGFSNWKVVGVNAKINAPFSATFRLKTEGSNGNWNTIGIAYGPNESQFITQAVSLTGSYTDFTITVDPSTISDWNTLPFPMYFGIQGDSLNILDPLYSPSYCYVESINIT